MDQVTQQNAALVEEAAAAAGSLQEQAHGLAQVVSVFKLREQPGLLRRPAPQPAAARPAPAPRVAARSIAVKTKPPAPAKALAGDDWEEF
ncbi:Methyl-accepting chemotaxis protein III [compost metagenome]